MSRKSKRNLNHKADPVRVAKAIQAHQRRIRRAHAAFAVSPNKAGELPFVNRHQEHTYLRAHRAGAPIPEQKDVA
jgi:hypothetical protein